MKRTVSGTDNQGCRHISQPSPSSEAKFDICPITSPSRHIIYTTAQLDEITTGIDDGYPLIWMRFSTSVFLFCFKSLFVVFLNKTGLSNPVNLKASKRKEGRSHRLCTGIQSYHKYVFIFWVFTIKSGASSTSNLRVIQVIQWSKYSQLLYSVFFKFWRYKFFCCCWSARKTNNVNKF